MKIFATYILIVIAPGDIYDCSDQLQAISEETPDADAYCLEPDYKMRPVARPEKW